MIIIQNKFSSFLLGKNYLAMCIAPFLFVAQGSDIRKLSETLNHEKIHASQQLEMLWIPFFLWYSIEYLVRLLIYRNHHQAYMNLSHEREAYSNAGNLNYLKTRKRYSWIKYLRKSTGKNNRNKKNPD
jgi:hypothetical protein